MNESKNRLSRNLHNVPCFVKKSQSVHSLMKEKELHNFVSFCEKGDSTLFNESKNTLT